MNQSCLLASILFSEAMAIHACMCSITHLPGPRSETAVTRTATLSVPILLLMTKKVEPLGSACLIIDVRLEMSLDDDYEGVSKLGAAYVKDGTDDRDLPPRCNTWR